MDTAAHSFLSDILHAFAQALLAPDIILLLAFVGYALFSIGSILVEYFTERRNFQVSMPKFLASLMSANEEDLPGVIAKSGLLNRQKEALLTIYDYRSLPGDSMLALIRRTMNNEETRYDRITGRNNMAAKVSPMLGLMGTLIPLGPGIEALGRADTSALSSSLLIAFDTTVTGLIVAAICLVIGKIRSNWYNDYLSALDSSMATMLQKIEDLRAAGKITTNTPSNYAFLFEKGLKNEAAIKDSAAQKEAAPATAAPGAPAPTALPATPNTGTAGNATPAARTQTSSPAATPNAATAGSAAPSSAATDTSIPPTLAARIAAAERAMAARTAQAERQAGNPTAAPAPNTATNPAAAPAPTTATNPAAAPAPGVAPSSSTAPTPNTAANSSTNPTGNPPSNPQV